MARGLEPLAATNRKEWFLRWIPPIISQLKLKNNVVVVMGRRRRTTAEFIESAREVHGDRYDYSKVEYVKSTAKICIICPDHGEFWQRADTHLKGCGCSSCGRIKSMEYGDSTRSTAERFIANSRKVHGDRYDYSKVEYINCSAKVCIICPDHGEFWQNPSNHRHGQGCPICGHKRTTAAKKLTVADFIECAREVHGDRYDYSKVEYVDTITKVFIICPDHGEFWQRPANHTEGKGCASCSTSKGELRINKCLDELGINYTPQQSFDDCCHKQVLWYDCYLPDINTLIEYHGIQHYQFEPFFHRDHAGFATCLLRDHIKREYARENGITLREISYEEFDNIDSILKELLENVDNM